VKPGSGAADGGGPLFGCVARAAGAVGVGAVGVGATGVEAVGVGAA